MTGPVPAPTSPSKGNKYGAGQRLLGKRRRASENRGRHVGKPGRKSRSKNTLGFGEVRAVELARIASQKLGESDPAVQELLAMVAAIARGDPGYRGRHTGERYRAITQLLDRILGKPVQRVVHGGKVGVTLEELLAGKVDAPASDGK